MLSNGIYIVVQLHSGQELDKYVVKELYKSVLNEFMVKVGNGKHLRVYCLLLEKCSTHFTSRLHAALPAVILFSNRILRPWVHSTPPGLVSSDSTEEYCI